MYECKEINYVLLKFNQSSTIDENLNVIFHILYKESLPHQDIL